MKEEKTLYYNYRTIDGYNAPINVVISKRGLGKTFGKVLKGFRKFYKHKHRFIYVVETEEMIDVLSQNHGEKFFSKIIEFLENNPSKRNKELLDFMSVAETEVTESSYINKIKGGTILVNGLTCGYIVSLNGFSKLKRNNFVDVSDIIIDEFIPEEINIKSLKNAYKMVSIVQSIARKENVKVWLLGNSIRLNDNILLKLKLTNLKLGEFRKVYDKYGLLVVCHYVDPKQYKQFSIEADQSVAGRLATLTGEDNLETNEFTDELSKDLMMPDNPKSSHFIYCLHGEAGSIRVHATKDYSEYYILEDYGKNKNNRYCLDSKYQTNIVMYIPEYKEMILNLYSQNKLKFENSYVLTIFKNILKLSQK